MLGEHEDTTARGAQSLKDAVSIKKAVIEDGHYRFLVRDEPVV
jgi:hypothetical protein